MGNVVIREAGWVPPKIIQLVRDGMRVRNRPAAGWSLAVNNKMG